MKVPFPLMPPAEFMVRAKFSSLCFGNAHAHFNLLSFLAPQIRENLITICADAERRNGD